MFSSCKPDTPRDTIEEVLKQHDIIYEAGELLASGESSPMALSPVSSLLIDLTVSSYTILIVNILIMHCSYIPFYQCTCIMLVLHVMY